MRVYQQEEMESKNYIFGKDRNNKYLTKQESEFVNQFDLFNRKMINVGKIIQDNRDNYKQLKKFQKIIKMEVKI